MSVMCTGAPVRMASARMSVMCTGIGRNGTEGFLFEPPLGGGKRRWRMELWLVFQ
jgi:hypothetical protein